MTPLAAIVITPRAATIALQRHPRWVLSFTLLALCWMVTTVILHPLSVGATVSRLPFSATEEDRAIVVQELDAELPFRLAVMPLRLAAGWGTFAVLLHLLGRAFAVGSPPTFLQLFSLEVHAEGVLLLGRWADVLYRMTIGHPTGSGVPDLPWSLAAFASAGGSAARGALLGSLNLFTLWYMLVLAGGISVLCGLRPPKALLIAATAWCISAGWSAAILTFLQNTFGLHP